MINVSLHSDAAQPFQVVASRRPRRTSARDSEWLTLRDRLAESLACLEAGQFLILQTRDVEPYYVQFAIDGTASVRVEAVSNRYLSGWRRLDATAEGRLRRLGWRPPTEVGDGPVNWWRCFDSPVLFDVMARLAVDTLRKAFDVPRPVALEYRAFARTGEEILLPTLGLAHDAAKRPLADRVASALLEMIEEDELTPDSDGDWPIRVGDAMVYVRAVAKPGYVAVYSPALLDVSAGPSLLEAVNHFNNSIRGARAAVRGTTITVSIEIDDQPEIGAAVINAYNAVSELTQACADELQPTFGGRRFFGEQRPANLDVPYGLYL